MTDDMISDTLARLTCDAQALELLVQLDTALAIAHGHLDNSDPPVYEKLAGQVSALGTVAEMVAANVRARVLQRASQLGWQVATYEIAPEAKSSGSEPIVFITGNSHMPPLRAYGISDEVWRLDDSDDGIWTAYAETIERRLGELRVYMACPDYDNALYVVDLERFEYVEGAAGDSLASEWRAIEQPES